MTRWQEEVIPTISMLDVDKIRVVLEVGDKELGVLYFERAKRGWMNKPLTNGWTCVDAKVGDLYGGYDVTPKEVVSWCQEKIREMI
jgi:hypothetical protein